MTPAGAAPDPQVAASMGLLSHFLKHPVPVADLPEYLRRGAQGLTAPTAAERLAASAAYHKAAAGTGAHLTVVSIADLPDYVRKCIPVGPVSSIRSVPAWLEQYIALGFQLVFWPRSADATDSWKGPREKNWTSKIYDPADYRDGMQVGVKLETEIAPARAAGRPPRRFLLVSRPRRM